MGGFRQAVPPQVQQTIRSAYRSLMDAGCAERKGQQQMISAIAVATASAKQRGDVPKGDRLLAVDAPTGSGKTLAYGLGAIPVAMAAGLKVIIASATVQLQEQIFGKDLVALQKVLPEMKVALVKGRSRYLCQSKLDEVCGTASVSTGSPVTALAHVLKTKLDEGSWTGDMDDLPETPDPMAWLPLTNDRSGCVGRSCSRYKDCSYFKARRSQDEAHVVVANIDLLLTDAMTDNRILPRMEDSVVIIDEAHELVAKAMGVMESQADLQWCHETVENAMRTLGRIASSRVRPDVGTLCRSAVDDMVMLGAVIAECEQSIVESGLLTSVRDKAKPLRLRKGEIPKWLEAPVRDGALFSQKSADALDAIALAIAESANEEGGDRTLERMVSAVGGAASRVRSMSSLWGLLNSSTVDNAPVAKWIQINDDNSLRLCASPVSVAGRLDELLWQRCAAAIHLSATLTTVGGFERHLRETGLDRTPGVATLEVESPFNYARQAKLIVPTNIANPRDAQQHTEDVTRIVNTVLGQQSEGEGALVLFASWRQLKEVALGLLPEIRERVLVQGEGLSKREILERHKRAIDAGQRSAILGTQSFEQGVDLAGKYLTALVVSKIQFAVPSNPVVEAQREYMEETLGLSYFDEAVVPDACRRLAQAAGRLLRTETDQGIIVLADVRLVQTKYGRRILKALPPFDLTRQELGIASQGNSQPARLVAVEAVACNSSQTGEDEDWAGTQARPF